MPLTRDPVSTLRFGILGPLVATVDRQDVNLGGRRQRAVVAVLLLARGRAVDPGRLLDAVWEDAPPRSGQASLQAYVSHLRRRLEPERAPRAPSTVLVSTGSGYALKVPDDAVDAWRFERLVTEATTQQDPTLTVRTLTEALALWRGPTLAGYDGQRWALADAHRLGELHDLAREQLLAARLDCGETTIVVPEIEALLREEPLREERWRLLALALYRSHRQADALATLRRARAMLAEDLGVDPGPALRALEAEVLAQSTSLDAPRARVSIPQQREAPSHGSDGLMDREQEMDRLRRCLGDALAGQAGLALIEGPAGIGKSRLLAEIGQEAAAAGVPVLSARGSLLEKEYGFGVVRQMFEPSLTDPARRGELLTGAAATAGGVFDATAAAAAHRSEGLFGVLHGLYWLTVNLTSAGPLVLTVDDVQWCDTGSLRYLTYLARRLEGMPMLVVATLRTGEQYPDEDLLAELVTDPVTVPVHPTPLSLGGVAELVRARLGPTADEAFITSCHRTTSGNPLLLRQLLRALEAERVRPDASHADTVRAIGSRAVSSMVLMRFARMPGRNRSVARAISVLGDGASLPVVASMADLSEAEAGTAIAALARSEVLRDRHPLGFVHPLVEDAVYNDLPLGERELQHDRAARVLAAANGSPEQVAAHLLLVPSRGDAGVVRVLRDAARRDLERGASDSATAYLDRALAEPPPADDLPGLLMELGRIEAQANGTAAIEHLTRAYRAFEDPVDRAEAAIVLARTLVFGGERGEAGRVAREARNDLPRELVDHRQGLLALERIGGYMHALDPASYDGHTRPGLAGTGPGARALAAALAWEDLLTSDHRDRAIELAGFAVEDGALHRVDAGLLWVVAGNVLEMAGVDTRVFWETALAEAYQRGALFRALSAHLWGGYVQWQRGDLREELQSMANCTEQNELWGTSGVGQPYADAFTARILLDRGDVAAARAAVEAARGHPRIGEGARLFGEAEAAVLHAEGRPDEALAHLDLVGREMPSIVNPVWRPWRSERATVLADLGRRGEAVALVEEELELARRWGAPAPVARALRLLGELRGPDGEPELRESFELLDGTGRLLEQARTLTALGKLLRARAGSADTARTVLVSALHLAEECAADGLHARIAATLVGDGIDVPARPAARSLLTATERRIALMTVEGIRARDIAQALFVTPRMVETTVGSVSDRLGVASLDELAAALSGT